MQAVVAFGRLAQKAVALWPGRLGLAVANVPHPSSRVEAALLDAWRQSVTDLRTIVTPDPDGDPAAATTARTFEEPDYAPIPARDLPFGVPPWLGDDAWGRARLPTEIASRGRRRTTVTRCTGSRRRPDREPHASHDPRNCPMPKTVTPGTIQLPSGDTFETNAVPDPFDARDLEYRPRLDVLPAVIDQRAAGRRFVYEQEGQSCTGHAVAAVINHVLHSTTARTRVSPYMLYRLARRYDEFPGEAEAGSSLRAAFKGWFNHGVALEIGVGQAEDASGARPGRRGQPHAWRDRPLGAFYRVNPFRLDDVQSAITELKAIAVSGIVHDGWISPVRVRKGSRTAYVIRRDISPRSRGGHAYCLVGYDEIGFLVQNSWGTDWGNRGFATLPYEDWLDSAYDAWVARPGVPQTPFYSGRTRTAAATGGALATGAGPDLRRLSYHVVNTGNDGGSRRRASSSATRPRSIGSSSTWARGTSSSCAGTGRRAATSCCGHTVAASPSRAASRSRSGT